MTDIEGPCYFWLVSPRMKTSVRNGIPYTDEALKQDLLRVRNAWEDAQGSRDRDAIYTYLTAVFELVAWWTAENRALERAQKALQLRRILPSDHEEPFAAIIRCTADPAKVDKRTRSKWSRALRYALAYKSPSEPLAQFIKRRGGINDCAARLRRRLGPKIGTGVTYQLKPFPKDLPQSSEAHLECCKISAHLTCEVHPNKWTVK
jgi:hypothetical protein